MRKDERHINRSTRGSGRASGPNTRPRTGRKGASKNKSSANRNKMYENRTLRGSLDDIYLGHSSRGLASVEDAAKLTLFRKEGFEYWPMRETSANKQGVISSASSEGSNLTVDSDIARILAGGGSSYSLDSEEETFSLELGDGKNRRGTAYAYNEWIVRAIGVRKRWVIPYDKIEQAKKAGFLVQRMGPECQPERVTKQCLEEIARETVQAGGKIIRNLNRSEEKDGVF